MVLIPEFLEAEHAVAVLVKLCEHSLDLEQQNLDENRLKQCDQMLE